ncbi:MAG: ribonuclease III [Chloroflexia bacterium]
MGARAVQAGRRGEGTRPAQRTLEFLGDSVLGLVVADWLLDAYPDVTEGELSRMKHRLVSTQTLARISRRLEIGNSLRIGRGEEKTGGRRKLALLADVFEALLAAIFLDGGFDEATAFVINSLGDELAEVTPEMAAAADFKTLLQERLQAEQHVAPQYSVIETDGPPHRRIFRVEVSWENNHVPGEGRTIKAAEMAAACRALEEIGAPPTAESSSQ